MRKSHWLIVAMALVAVACGGGDGDAETGPDTQAGNDGGSSGGILSTDFSTSDLPSDFPSDLVPPGLLGGEFTDITGLDSASFETSMSYEEAVDYYTDLLGEPTSEVGDDDGRLASWSSHGPWAIGVFDTDPTTTTAVRVPTE